MGLSPTVWPCVSIALTHSNLLGFQTMACTPQDSKTFNLADEIFPKDKVAPPPKKPGKQPRKKDTGATTKPSTSSHTPAPNQHGDDVSNEEVEPGNQAAPELANLFKEQFAAMQVHREGFVSKLVDSRTSVQPTAAIQSGNENAQKWMMSRLTASSANLVRTRKPILRRMCLRTSLSNFDHHRMSARLCRTS